MKRQLFVAAVLAVVCTGTLSGIPAHANEETTIIKAQGNPYLNDFMVRSNKRADLRINLIRKGRNAAFTDWLRNERPFAYREYARQTPAADVSGQIRTSWHPLLNDFLVLSNKRADLHLNVARKGLDAAFVEWLQTERANAKH